MNLSKNTKLAILGGVLAFSYIAILIAMIFISSTGAAYHLIKIEEGGVQYYAVEHCLFFHNHGCNIFGYRYPDSEKGRQDAEDSYNYFARPSGPTVLEIIK